MWWYLWEKIKLLFDPLLYYLNCSARGCLVTCGLHNDRFQLSSLLCNVLQSLFFRTSLYCLIWFIYWSIDIFFLDFAISDWISGKSLPSTQPYAWDMVQMLLRELGVADYLNDKQCDPTAEPYISNQHGWNISNGKDVYIIKKAPSLSLSPSKKKKEKK